MNKQEQIDKVQSVINSVEFTMLTTRTPEGRLFSCPMNTIETSIGAREIWFIGHNPSDTATNINHDAEINLSYKTNDNKEYISIAGRAELVEDREKLEALWAPLYEAFYPDGKEDSRVQLIKVVPHGIEYWNNGNVIANAAKVGAAMVTDKAYGESMGENFSIQL